MRATTLVMTVLATAAVAASGVGAGVAAAQASSASSASTTSGPASTSSTSTTSPPSPLIDCGQLPTPVDPSHTTFDFRDQAVTPIRSDQTGQWGFWYQNCFVALQ